MLVCKILVPEAIPGTVRKDRLESSADFLRTTKNLLEQYAKETGLRDVFCKFGTKYF